MKKSGQIASVTVFSSALALIVSQFPETKVDIFRIHSALFIPFAIVFFFLCFRLAVGLELSRRSYFGLLPLAFYLALSLTLAGLLADHYGESRIKPASELIRAHWLEVVYSFCFWAVLMFFALWILAILGVHLGAWLRGQSLFANARTNRAQ